MGDPELNEYDQIASWLRLLERVAKSIQENLEKESKSFIPEIDNKLMGQLKLVVRGLHGLAYYSEQCAATNHELQYSNRMPCVKE